MHKLAVVGGLMASALHAATYYVDDSHGSDTASGLTATTPWKTLAKVQGAAFAPGDQILLRRGERWRESLTFPSSGTPQKPITISDYGTGPLPIIDGSQVVTGWTLSSGSVYYKSGWSFPSQAVYQDETYLKRGSSNALSPGEYWYEAVSGRLYVRMTDSSSPSTKTVEATRYPNQWHGLIRLDGKSYVTIQNLDLRKSNHFSFLIQNGSDHITVRQCRIDRSYQNAFEVKGELGTSNSSNIHLLYNSITMSGIARAYMGTGESEAVGVSFVGVQGGSIIGNRVTDQGGEGIQCNGGASNLLITDNTVINPYVVGYYIGGGWGNGGHTRNITFSHNYMERGPLTISQGMSISTEYAKSPFTFNDAADTITATWNVTWLDDYPVTFTGVLPTPLLAGTVYYTKNRTGTTFQVSASMTGPPIALSGSISGTSYVHISHRIDGVQFYGNVVKGNGDTLGCYAFGNGQFAGGNIRNVHFHHNTCTNSAYGVIAMGPTDDASNVFADNSLGVTPWGRAYWIGENPGVPNAVSNYRIDGDSVYSPTGSSFIVEIGGSTIPFASGVLQTLAKWRESGNATHTVEAPISRSCSCSLNGSPVIGIVPVL